MQIAYILVYLVIAYYIARWRSGLLPVAAALAIVLAMFAAISAPGWFDRDGRRASPTPRWTQGSSAS